MGESTKRVLVSGARGLVGSALSEELSGAGYQVERLVRRRDFDGVYWDPAVGSIQTNRLEGVFAVIHLAGESIGEGRWSAEKKGRIRNSRVQGTRLLAEAIASLNNPPKVMLSASAVGYYGDAGAHRLTESAALGAGFLAGVCRHWEQACEPARQAGVRVVNMRLGLILSEKGGVLQRLLPAYRMCAGGRVGTGEQFMSWVMLEDVIQSFKFALENESLDGSVNVVSPSPVTNAEFAKALGSAVGRPAICHVPSLAIRLALGEERAENLLLYSQRAIPAALKEAGFRFRYADIKSALEAITAR